MSSPAAKPAAPANRGPRVRKSIAHPRTADIAMDQENQTMDVLASARAELAAAKANNKSRSKSMGPGGLDALKETSGNRRKSAAVPPKSILKPTIPLSPLREIPTRKSPSAASKSPAKSPLRNATNASSMASPTTSRGRGNSQSKGDDSVGSGSGQQSVLSENQRADGEGLAKQDPEAEERKRRKAEIQKQRELRRKSMANRRVSFAPEATLHTWDTEMLQDSTPSSESNARRGSAAGTDRPATPPEQFEVERSPEHQRDAHQKKRRRSSGVPPMNFNDPEALSSSPLGGSSVIDEDETVTSPRSFEDHESSSGSEAANDTLGEATMQSLDEGTGKSTEHDDTDASLQEAAERAGTRGVQVDENGDVSMELAEVGIASAFKPWVYKNTGMASPHPRLSTSRDQENINPFSPSFRLGNAATQRSPSVRGDDDMSMDMTRAVGGIVQNRPGRKSMGRRQSMMQRRRSPVGNVDLGDGTMDFTAAVGGLKPKLSNKSVDSAADENEELSMEFTTVFGGLKGKQQESVAQSRDASRRQQTQPDQTDDVDMDMTAAVGSILPGRKQQTQEEDSDTKIDFTLGVGGIAPKQPTVSARPSINQEAAFSAVSQLRRSPLSKPPRPSLVTSATGSSSVVSTPRGRGRPDQSEAAVFGTPNKIPRTPPKQITPIPPKPITPGKTPPSANVAMRKQSPKKLFQNEIRAAASPKPTTPRLFSANAANGRSTPKVILAPKSGQRRRVSGVGIDKEGLGSPSVAAILDRRTSIGEKADVFVPGNAASKGVRFGNPRVMAAEVSRESDEDQRRESAQFAMNLEADIDPEGEKDATANLRELMQSMTPKKNKFKGRKSLAIGAAKGVLGKRPAELDDSDEEPSPHTFGKASSPVKKVRLGGPSSAAETTGRPTRKSGPGLFDASGNARPVTPHGGSSPMQKTAATPKSQGRFKNAELLPSAQKPLPTLGQNEPVDAEKAVGDDDSDRIGLQDFLNLTNIKFMELTTTKRRPTTVQPGSKENEDTNESSQDPDKLMEDSIVAGACTIPMLELFQHSCRELKKYISEGRSVVREIEEDTQSENPPVFREYMCASAQSRALMDNQFKNMKTNARLVSKAQWYDWRMKLLEGLMANLRDTKSGMDADGAALDLQEGMLSPILPEATARFEEIQCEHAQLKIRTEELAECDPEDLQAARERLKTVDEELHEKCYAVEEHHETLQELDAEIDKARQAKHAAQSATREALRQREECRGWSVAEVKSVQSRVDDLQKQSGWAITSAAGSILTLLYQNELELTFNAAAFAPLGDDTVSVLTLSYMSDKGVEMSTTQRFFLQLLRAQLHAQSPRTTHASALVGLVSSGWSCVQAVEQQLKTLRLRCGITAERIMGDERLALDTTVLLPDLKSKVAATFELHVGVGGDQLMVHVDTTARAVYGEDYKEERMTTFLRKRVSALEDDWAEAVAELRAGLVRSRKK